MKSNYERLFLKCSRADIVLIALITGWTGLQYFILGKYSLVINGDELNSVFSVLMGTTFSEDIRALWYRFAATGSDQLAFSYTPDFDLFLVKLLPGWLAYQVRHLLMLFASVFGVFVICRAILKMERPGSLFAAFAVGTWLSLGQFYMAAVAFLPLLIVSISFLLRNSKSIGQWSVTLLVAAFYATTAHMNFLVLFPFLVIGVWFLVIDPRTTVRDWIIIFGLFIFIVLLRAQDILALLYNAPYSHRAHWVQSTQTFVEALTPGFNRVAETFDPKRIFSLHTTFSFQAVPFFAYATILGLCLRWRTNENVRRVGVFIAAVMALEILLPGLKHLFYDLIPPIRGFSINKLWLMATWAIAVGAGIGFQSYHDWLKGLNWSWLTERARKAMVMAPIVFVMFFSGIEKIWFSAYEWLSQGNYVQIYQSPVLEKLARKIHDSGELSRVTMFQMYDSYAQGYGLETPGGMLVLFSKRYSDYWGKMYEPSANIDPLVDQILENYQQTMMLGMTFDPKLAIREPEQQLGPRFHLNLLSLANVRYFVSRDKLTDEQFKLTDIGNPDGPWSGLSRKEKIMVSLKANFTGKTQLYVYENTQALPRFFLSKAVTIQQDRLSALNAIANSSIDRLRDSVILAHEDVPQGFDVEERFSDDGSVVIEEYGSDFIKLKVDASAPALLVGTNSYSPYWIARVDGVVTPILPAYTTFWSVRLPKGASYVTFSYEPPYRVLY